MGEEAQGADVELLRRQHLEAVVVFACPHCGAPGAYHHDPSVLQGWPGCWVEKGDPNDHQTVGDICPNCYGVRLPNEHKGTVWYREWWARVFSRGSR